MQVLPMMPIREVVVFPHMMAPFVVGRKSSVRALDAALAGNRRIFLATQRDASVEEPRADQIYRVGTIVNIVQSMPLPNGPIKVLVEGAERAELVSTDEDEGFFRATVQTAAVEVEQGPRVDALVERVAGIFEAHIRRTGDREYEGMASAIAREDPARLADLMAATAPLTVPEKQELLEIPDPIERLRRIGEMLDSGDDRPGPSIHLEWQLAAPRVRVYEVLLDARQFGTFTDMAAEIAPREGAAFRLFGGLVEGRNVELVPGRRMVQAWRRKSWPAGVYSMVRFDLEERDGGTRLVLNHTGIPEEQRQYLKESWESTYGAPLRRYLAA